MTLQEFKAWFSAFSDAIGDGFPTPDQWKKIKAKVGELDAKSGNPYQSLLSNMGKPLADCISKDMYKPSQWVGASTMLDPRNTSYNTSNNIAKAAQSLE